VFSQSDTCVQDDKHRVRPEKGGKTRGGGVASRNFVRADSSMALKQAYFYLIELDLSIDIDSILCL
jgi:hypothetical protein